VDLARLGKGSLVVSVFTPDAGEAGRLALGLGAHHGRVLLVDERCGKTQTGPAAARSWAGSARCTTTSSGWPCRGRPTRSRPSPARSCPAPPGGRAAP